MGKLVILCALLAVLVYTKMVQNIPSSDDATKSMIMNYYTKRNLASLMRQKGPHQNQNQTPRMSTSPYESDKRNIQSIKAKGMGKRYGYGYVDDNDFILPDGDYDSYDDEEDEFIVQKRFLGRIPQMGPARKTKTTTKYVWN